MERRSRRSWVELGYVGVLSVAALGASACSSGGPASGGPEGVGSTAGNGGVEPGGAGAAGGAGPAPVGPSVDDPGTTVSVAVAPEVIEPIWAELELARAEDAESLITSRAVSFEPSLGHDPRSALGLDLIQGSALALNEVELAQLSRDGFVILRRKQYPSFPYGYFDVYAADLPVYVSADMVLEAVHRSYDDILTAVERAELVPRLSRLITAMRARLASGQTGLSDTAAADADLFLSVAESLLSGAPATTVTGLDPSEARSIVAKAMAASGSAFITLFGRAREEDFSQFEPRGHYTDEEVLQRYFRAMMWLGRIDLRLIETLPDGSRKFWRRQLETALALAALLDGDSREDFAVIDAAVAAFVGEHDYMTVPELDELLAALGTSREDGLGELSDDAIAAAIIEGRYGEQRIASHLIRKLPGAPATLPLSASFAFFGQRYTVDSHVFSNVVFDRVQTRVLPNPLDAAFAALGNDHAVSLIAGELLERPYAGALAAMRALVDAHPSDYWQGSLYTSWLDALRTLSPSAGGAAQGSAAAPDAEGLPAVARMEPWARRILNTQLASWAELRHDTLLYAKQSYTGGSLCEFPDAYVEPYPEFFHAITRFAERGRELAVGLELSANDASLGQAIETYFTTLGSIATTLGEMAELQRSGLPHSPEHVEFINRAIRVEAVGCGQMEHTGWYKDLFFDQATALDFDPTIADVHTDAGGDIPFSRGPSVLHVGTGYPRPMIVSVDTCSGPRAYAGVVFSYHEHTEQGLVRSTDEEWATRLSTEVPPDVPWLEPVLGPR